MTKGYFVFAIDNLEEEQFTYGVHTFEEPVEVYVGDVETDEDLVNHLLSDMIDGYLCCTIEVPEEIEQGRVYHHVKSINILTEPHSIADEIVFHLPNSMVLALYTEICEKNRVSWLNRFKDEICSNLNLYSWKTSYLTTILENGSKDVLERSIELGIFDFYKSTAQNKDYILALIGSMGIVEESLVYTVINAIPKSMFPEDTKEFLMTLCDILNMDSVLSLLEEDDK